MAERNKNTKSERVRRSDPEREAPHRSGAEHIRRNARRDNDADGPRTRISETLDMAISDMVRTGSRVIEDQIRAGQNAAERMRDSIAGSERFNGNSNELVESLVKATKEISSTWLELLTIALQSMGTSTRSSGHAQESTPRPGGGPRNPGTAMPRTATKTGSSGGATTTSTITPANPAIDPVPIEIVVTGTGVKNVTLDMRPPTADFMPFVCELAARDRKSRLSSAQFSISEKQIVLSVVGPRDQAPGVYSGVVVDTTSNQAGGTVSVTIGG
jgi:hypothetical protein